MTIKTNIVLQHYCIKSKLILYCIQTNIVLKTTVKALKQFHLGLFLTIEDPCTINRQLPIDK